MGAEEIIKHSGLKFTKGRKAILDVLMESNQPVDAEKLFLVLKNQSVNLNLSTVYRNLESLENANLITKISFMNDDRNLYEYNGGGHRHYVICINCKKIVVVKHCPLSNYEKDVEAETGFSVCGHRLYLYGYCSECQKTVDMK